MATQNQFTLDALRIEDIIKGTSNYIQNTGGVTADLNLDGSNIGYILKSLGYVSMLHSYQNVQLANNLFLDTTQNRKNAVSIANQITYVPKRKLSARVIGKIEYIGSGFTSTSTITIPARTVFFGSDTSSSFINLIPITLTYVNSILLSSEFTLYEGQFKTFEQLGTGEDWQQIVIKDLTVENDNLNVYMQETGTQIKRLWEQATSFSRRMTNNVYRVEEDVNEYYPKIVFGNGSDLTGAIPTTAQTIVVEYLSTKGDLGNNENTIALPTNLNSVATFFNVTGFNVNNFTLSLYKKSYGGKDYETLDEIKYAAPLHYSAAGRGVTNADYLSIFENQYKNLVQYYNIIGGNEFYPYTTEYDGFAFITAVPFFSETEFTNNLKIYLTDVEESNILPLLKEQTVISTRRKFFKPTYLYIDLNSQIEIPGGLTANEIQTIIATGHQNLKNYYNENITGLGKTYRQSKLHAALESTTNVLSATLTSTMFFVINADSFYDSRTTQISLPVVYKRDTNGNIIYENDIPLTTNFLKKRSEIATELSKTQFTLLPSESSIYGQLNHANSDRFIHNKDILDIEFITFDLIGANDSVLSNKTFSFKNASEVEYFPSLIEIATDQWSIRLNSIQIGVLLRATGTNNFSISSTAGEKAVMDNIGIVPIGTEYILLDSLTETTTSGTVTTYFSVHFNLVTDNLSDVILYSKTKLCDIVFDYTNWSWTFINKKTFIKNSVQYPLSELQISADEKGLSVNNNAFVSIINTKGTFTLNNYNHNYLLDFDQRNDLELQTNYTLTAKLTNLLADNFTAPTGTYDQNIRFAAPEISSIVTVTDNGVKESLQINVTNVVDVSLLNNQYFIIREFNNDTTNLQGHAFWFNYNATGTAPLLATLQAVDSTIIAGTVHEISVPLGSNLDNLAILIKNSIDAIVEFNAVINGLSTTKVDVTNTYTGAITYPGSYAPNNCSPITFTQTVIGVTSLLRNKYFLLYAKTVLGTEQLYTVWYKVDGSNTAPVVAGAINIAVPISGGDLNSVIATKTVTAITNTVGVLLSATSSTSTITVTNTYNGNVTAAVDSTSPTGFTISTVKQGYIDAQFSLIAVGDVLNVTSLLTENSGKFLVQSKDTTFHTVTVKNRVGLAEQNAAAIVNTFNTNGTFASFTVYCFDVYHNSSIGILNYITGDLEFKQNVKGYIDFANKQTITKTVKSLFELNYSTAHPMDLIQITSKNNYNYLGKFIGNITDFDGKFNQNIQIDILQPTIKV